MSGEARDFGGSFNTEIESLLIAGGNLDNKNVLKTVCLEKTKR